MSVIFYRALSMYNTRQIILSVTLILSIPVIKIPCVRLFALLNSGNTYLAHKAEYWMHQKIIQKGEKVNL